MASKTKFRLVPEGLETWEIAALWEGSTVVLLTTAAHPSIAHVHDRMPCVVGVDQAAGWFEGDGALTPFPSVALEVD